MKIRLKALTHLSVVIIVLLAVTLVQRHGQPIALYGLGSVGFAAVGLTCFWLIISKHKDMTRQFAPWIVTEAMGTPFLSYCYVLSFLAAWQGRQAPSQAFASFAVGLGFLMIGGVGLIAVVCKGEKAKRRAKRS